MRTSASRAFAQVRLSCGMHHRYCPTQEAERMVQRGECVRKRLPGQRHKVYLMVDPPEPSESSPTPATVTVADMLAYVGLGRPQRVEAAREKIGEISLTAARWAA